MAHDQELGSEDRTLNKSLHYAHLCTCTVQQMKEQNLLKRVFMTMHISVPVNSTYPTE